jgi:hypothetical protein
MAKAGSPLFPPNGLGQAGRDFPIIQESVPTPSVGEG